MDKAQIYAKIVEFLLEKGPLPASDEAIRAFNYLDDSFIDSMQFVDMVLRFEKEFGVRFEPEHLQSEEFRTVGGLAEIVAGLSGVSEQGAGAQTGKAAANA